MGGEGGEGGQREGERWEYGAGEKGNKIGYGRRKGRKGRQRKTIERV